MDIDWKAAKEKYDWEVDLRRFKNSDNYPGYFNRIITKDCKDVKEFTKKFKEAVDGSDPTLYVIAGEVCFWKNNRRAGNNNTQSLLNHLKNPEKWETFTRSLKIVSSEPSWENFKELCNACGQKNGFATPITFLAFYNPEMYPMADKHIAEWWNKNKERFGYETEPGFKQRDDGYVPNSPQNWKAYLAWYKFCRVYASSLRWRARDVEMSVFSSQRNRWKLPIL